MMEHLLQACKFFSLVISAKKTVIVTKLGATQGNKPLEVVKKFSCLGSTVTSIASLNYELCVRRGKAPSTFDRLRECTWKNKMLTVTTKIRTYLACKVSTLLYGSEAWRLYIGQEKNLNVFRLRCLRLR